MQSLVECKGQHNIQFVENVILKISFHANLSTDALKIQIKSSTIIEYYWVSKQN